MPDEHKSYRLANLIAHASCYERTKQTRSERCVVEGYELNYSVWRCECCVLLRPWLSAFEIHKVLVSIWSTNFITCTPLHGAIYPLKAYCSLCTLVSVRYELNRCTFMCASYWPYLKLLLSTFWSLLLRFHYNTTTGRTSGRCLGTL
jgi:hypothetical protein